MSGLAPAPGSCKQWETYTIDAKEQEHAESRLTGRGGSLACGVLLLALLVFHGWANWWWLGHDMHALHNDDSLHMESARNYFLLLTDTEQPLPMRLLDMFDVQNYYPPLLHVIGAAALAVWGYHPDLLVGTVTAYFLLLILGSYAIARCYTGPWNALFAAVVVAFTPILYGASRTFMTDYLSAAIVVWAMYCLLKCNCFRHTGWVFCFSLLNGAGIMTRPTTFVFYLLPCVVLAGLGLAQAFRQRGEAAGSGIRWGMLGIVLQNCALCVVVTLGIVLPWYLHHFDFLYEFYTTHFYGGEGVFRENVPGLDVQIVVGVLFGAGLLIATAVYGGIALHRAVKQHGWNRYAWLWAGIGTLLVGLALCVPGGQATYAVFLLSDGVFLPLALLGCLGAFLAFSKDRRSLPLLLVLLWFLGSYVLLTVLFTSRVPRYIIPAVPPLALFAALACTAIRPAALRAVAVGGLLGLLGLQFHHLTVGPKYAPATVALPAITQHEKAPLIARSALPILKDHIVAGSYAFRPAQEEPGFDNRLLAAMAEDMRTRRPIYEDWANYQRLSNFGDFEGMWFVESHYRPEPNPFIISEVEPAPRPIRSIGMRWQSHPEELLERLGETDYILTWSTYRSGVEIETSQTGRDWAQRRDKLWRSYFEENGYTVLDHFEMPAYNNAQDGFYTLLGRSIETREPYREWDFTQGIQRQRIWNVVGDARLTPEGLTRTDNRNGPFLELRNSPVVAAECNVIRIVLDSYREKTAGRVPAPPETMHFYWAYSAEAEDEAWPFDTERGIQLRKTGPQTWEANLRRHPRWIAEPDAFMIDAVLQPSPLGPMDATLRWDFTTLPKQLWDWDFAKGADRAPSVEGALRMTEVDGPHMTLVKTLRCDQYRAMLLRLELFHQSATGARPVEPTSIRVYWASPERAAAQTWPFDRAHSAEFSRARGALSEYYAADLASNAGWRGAAQRIMIEVDVPEELLQSPGEHFSIYTKDLALAGFDGNSGDLRMDVRKIEFLK